jgi:OOP family OmpA-OmpF porin
MKKTYLLSLFAFLCSFYGISQENTSSAVDFNRWSIEGNFGINKPDENFASGYWTADPNTYFAVSSIRHFDLGVRYMLNETFGLKFDAGYDIIKPEKDNSSKDFENRMYRLGLQGVVNLRNLFNFNSFSKRLGLLAHFGVHANRLDPQFRTFADYSDLKEDNGGYMFGLTPQFKLSNRFALTFDVTFIKNLRQHLTWDGDRSPNNYNLSASIVNTSLGVTYYLGKNDVHADWVDRPTVGELSQQIGSINNDLDKIQQDMLDTDKDGVPDYLDREPNTTNGVAVNTKGESVDQNQNGIPDELETILNNMYITKQYAKDNYYGNGIEAVKPNANDKMISVYFGFDSTKPAVYSLNTISQIVSYMDKHKDTNAVLTGYADNLGNSEYNQKLSESRAKIVYDLIVSLGIDPSRLTYKGAGVDDTIKNADSPEARQILRQVTFQLD